MFLSGRQAAAAAAAARHPPAAYRGRLVPRRRSGRKLPGGMLAEEAAAARALRALEERHTARGRPSRARQRRRLDEPLLSQSPCPAVREPLLMTCGCCEISVLSCQRWQIRTATTSESWAHA